MLELTSPAPLAPGRLRLLEPDGSSPSALLKQLIDGTYDKPFIEDSGPLRYLHFDLDNVQSVMRHDDPDALCLAYTRKMMTFLLFNAEPRRILLLGLGGGLVLGGGVAGGDLPGRARVELLLGTGAELLSPAAH